MSEVVRQLPTLLGVLVGAIATYFVTTAAERARWRRDQTIRWDAKRMEVYAEYGRAVKRVTDLAVRIAMARGVRVSQMTGRETLQPDEGLPVLAQAEAERGAIWESVLLLGSPEAVSAARRWHEAVWYLDWFARGTVTPADEGYSDKWGAAFHAAGSARDDFYRCARQDLGVVHPDLPVPAWGSWWLSPSKTTDNAGEGGQS